MGIEKLLLIINLGSTSTKVAIYNNETLLASRVFQYDSKMLNEKYSDIFEQEELRTNAINEFLKENNISITDIDAVVTRGAMVKPVPSGTIIVTDQFVKDALKYGGFHPVALGVKVAKELADSAGVVCLTVDPPTTDELTEVARISGFPEIEREVQYQPLNQKRVAHLWAEHYGKRYEEVNLIVVHLGGGTTIGAHERGRIIDVNSGNLGEGPMTPERPGGIPLIPIIKECFSGDYTLEEMERRVYHGGGIKKYLGTSDIQEVERRINEGDMDAELILHAFAYQVSKEIGASYAIMKGICDGIILTGGAAFSKYLVGKIGEYVNNIAPIHVIPGGDEFGGLAYGAMRYLRQEIELIDYDSLPERKNIWHES